MSLEAWGDGGDVGELSDRDVERIEERAREYAVEDDAGEDEGGPLVLPDGVSLDAIELEPLDTDHYEFKFRASYGGRSIEVCVPGDILEPSEPDWD